MKFVQVHLLTNLVPSESAGDRSGAAHVVIRRLFGVGAGYRLFSRGKGTIEISAKASLFEGGGPLAVEGVMD